MYFSSPPSVDAQRPSASDLLADVANLQTRMAAVEGGVAQIEGDYVSENGGTFSGNVEFQENVVVAKNAVCGGAVQIGSTAVDATAATAGTIRWNGNISALEVSDGAAWQPIQMGAQSGSPSGSTFVRWGSSFAPAGTSLVYTGEAYASHYTHYGSLAPIVVGDMEGIGGGINTSPIYPLLTGGAAPGIPQNRYVNAAVCQASGPTAIIWGTHTAPYGWRVLYVGYAMGPYYSHSGPDGPILVDSTAFDGAVASMYTALIYPQTAGGSLIKGALIEKM